MYVIFARCHIDTKKEKYLQDVENLAGKPTHRQEKLIKSRGHDFEKVE